MTEAPLRVFALRASAELGARVAARLGVRLDPLEEREFEDGEHKSRPLCSVRDCDVYVIQSLYADPGQSANDKLCRLLFLLGTLRDAGAARVTAVVPYLCYARKDRKSKARDPTTTRYVAALFEAVGVDRVVGVEVHNPAAFQNAFRCGTEHLDARLPLVEAVLPLLLGSDPAVVLSPDAGGIKRAESFRRTLAQRLRREVELGFMEKFRSAGVLSGNRLAAQVDGRDVVIVDDLISTGSTMQRAARAAREQGAKRIYAVATHGLFTGDADRVLGDPAIARVLVTDTIPPFRLDPGTIRSKVTVVEISGLLAEAIRRLHAGGSIVELLGYGAAD